MTAQYKRVSVEVEIDEDEIIRPVLDPALDLCRAIERLAEAVNSRPAIRHADRARGAIRAREVSPYQLGDALSDLGIAVEAIADHMPKQVQR